MIPSQGAEIPQAAGCSLPPTARQKKPPQHAGHRGGAVSQQRACPSRRRSPQGADEEGRAGARRSERSRGSPSGGAPRRENRMLTAGAVCRVSLGAWHCASCPCDRLASARWPRLRGTGTQGRQGSRAQLWKQPGRSDTRTRVTAVTCSEMAEWGDRCAVMSSRTDRWMTVTG